MSGTVRVSESHRQHRRLLLSNVSAPCPGPGPVRLWARQVCRGPCAAPVPFSKPPTSFPDSARAAGWRRHGWRRELPGRGRWGRPTDQCQRVHTAACRRCSKAKVRAVKSVNREARRAASIKRESRGQSCHWQYPATGSRWCGGRPARDLSSPRRSLRRRPWTMLTSPSASGALARAASRGSPQSYAAATIPTEVSAGRRDPLSRTVLNSNKDHWKGSRPGGGNCNELLVSESPPA